MLVLTLLTALMLVSPTALQPAIGAADAASAAESLWFDGATGRSTLNYPPHRSADIRHIRLDLSVPDMNTPRIDGVATITLEPLGRPLASLRLNAAEMQVTSVTCEDCTTGFTYDKANEELTVRFDPPVPLGKQVDLTVTYVIIAPTEGIIWTTESPAHPGRAAQFHSQGEAESARYWFPCVDFPSERQSGEVVVTVPAGFTAVSNGHMISHDSAQGKETFHWRQDREAVAYLFTLVVGKFDIVDVAPTGSRTPMPVYAPPGQGAFVPATFGRTPRMVALYEKLFDEPFPWDKYAQVLVWNFAWGGMENSSATTLVDTTLLDRAALLDGDEDSLISHELAHQWFGDLITCRTWEHIWLNEGFATYCEKLWEQYRGSTGAALTGDDDAYLWGMLQDFTSICSNDRGDDAFQPSMQCKCYAHPIEVFEKSADPYSKGSAILHMLRERLGDEAFFHGLSVYLDRHGGRSAETYDLRRTLEDIGGVSLQRFFDQWCKRPGVPRLAIKDVWNAADQTLAITIEQTQRIDGGSPAYAFTMPVWVKTASGTRQLDIPVDRTTTEFTAKLDGEPQAVVFDPRLAVLAEKTVTHPEDTAAAMWLAQLRDGPTVTARIQAADGLAFTVAPKRPDAPPHSQVVAALNALTDVVQNESLPFGLRQKAAEALGRMANPASDGDRDVAAEAAPTTFPDRNAGAALATLAQGNIDDARVRRTVIEQLARAASKGGTTDTATRARVLSLLSERFHRDPSYGVRAAAVKGAGAMKAEDGLAMVREALTTESFGDRIRQAGLEAFAEFDGREAFDAALKYIAPGNQQFTRGAAAEALAKLSHHDEGKAIAALTSMLGENSQRAKYGAAEALGKIGSPAAKAALDKKIQETTSREFKSNLRQALAGEE